MKKLFVLVPLLLLLPACGGPPAPDANGSNLKTVRVPFRGRMVYCLFYSTGQDHSQAVALACDFGAGR